MYKLAHRVIFHVWMTKMLQCNKQRRKQAIDRQSERTKYEQNSTELTLIWVANMLSKTKVIVTFWGRSANNTSNSYYKMNANLIYEQCCCRRHRLARIWRNYSAALVHEKGHTSPNDQIISISTIRLQTHTQYTISSNDELCGDCVFFIFSVCLVCCRRCYSPFLGSRLLYFNLSILGDLMYSQVECANIQNNVFFYKHTGCTKQCSFISICTIG